MRRLFRLQNVSTKRRDKINSDEEERMHMGYEIISGLRFAEHDGRVSARTAVALGPTSDSSEIPSALARLTYGHTATVWRINLGWTRRKDKSQQGFLLDLERGYWARNEAVEDEEMSDPMSPSRARVIPYVEDRRNCLLVQPDADVDAAQMASLQAALKNALQVLYQLEDGELAAEALPSADDRRFILIYESAEGGAGVLRRLVDDPRAFGEVARKALEVCHFDPATGQDLRHSPRAKEDCEAACYDCLMSYSRADAKSSVSRNYQAGELKSVDGWMGQASLRAANLTKSACSIITVDSCLTLHQPCSQFKVQGSTCLRRQTRNELQPMPPFEP